MDKAFKFCSRIRGKKVESAALLADLLQLIDESFGSVSQPESATKRARDSDEDADNHDRKKFQKVKALSLSADEKV